MGRRRGHTAHSHWFPHYGCLREYGWASKRDSIGDSLSEAQPFLKKGWASERGSFTNEKLSRNPKGSIIKGTKLMGL